jgi:hypothetical protein
LAFGTVRFFLKFAVTRGTDNVSMPDNNSIGRSIQLDANRRRHAVTERTSQNFNVILRNTRQCRLTKEQVFRLWKCAVKDDDKLVDTAIEQLYEEMIAFDLARAETVIQLIIERHEAAAPTFRDLLQDIATSGLPKAGRSDRTPSVSAMQHLQELGMPRELIRPIISISKTNDPDVNA